MMLLYPGAWWVIDLPMKDMFFVEQAWVFPLSLIS